MIRTFHHASYPVELLRERKRGEVTVVLPAREVADTIGPIVEAATGLGGLVDQVLVVDAASADGSAEIARSLGAEVHQEADLLPDFGPVLGKGDAMWRALSVARGEHVVFLDSDTLDFEPHFVTGMLGPLICHGVRFLKGAFRRPLDGGRVTELTARPLFSAFYPELAVFAQPLAGEVAAPRSVLERIPFATGYAVEASMLLHARDVVGISAMAQVDLDERRQPHQPLTVLGPMAYAVLSVVLERLRTEGRLLDDPTLPLVRPDGSEERVELVERPPLASLSTVA